MTTKISAQSFDHKSALIIENYLIQLQNKKDKIFVALSGGSTPLPILFELSKSINLKWEKFHFFLVDERCVSITDPESNYGQIKKFFYDHISTNYYSIIKEGSSVEESIKSYLNDLKKIDNKGNNFPEFDLMLLGMGEDGHIASLFPETSALKENAKPVVKNYIPSLKKNRITLTYPVILNSIKIIVIIKGEKKREIYEKINIYKEPIYPIQKIFNEREDLEWIIETNK